MRLFVLARHGRSVLNLKRIVNGDPLHDLGLAPQGIEEAQELGRQLSAIPVDLAVSSQFPRAVQTVDAALEGRDIPRMLDEDLGDIRIGSLDGVTLDDYHHSAARADRNLPFPDGESLNDAARRYADAFERLLARPEPVTLVVCHEYPVRYAVNAAAGSDEFDAPFRETPNATPYLFDEPALSRAVTRIRDLAS
ncbi:MAG TPA: histidine phosphatase family protein [Gaiellaceae bacterium]|jgi:broad specificity phosphatase PhoE|nr:histidine phosphatase family protein [Gaiellaceae bacterium]